jgi:hypothetical protein
VLGEGLAAAAAEAPGGPHARRAACRQRVQVVRVAVPVRLLGDLPAGAVPVLDERGGGPPLPPTAQTSLPLTACTASRSLSRLGLGVAATVQRVPSKCPARVSTWLPVAVLLK